MKRPGALVGLLIAVLLLLGVLAALLGWAVGNQTASKTKTVTAASRGTMAAPAGHMGGPNLAIAQIGDPARGARLWESKRCSDCHSYGGRGGEDAPPLDFMRGHMSAREIADMSGQIWDHLPAMLPHFREEEIPVPTFTQGEMADLIAFLHSGKGAKAGATAAHPGMQGMAVGSAWRAARESFCPLAAGPITPSPPPARRRRLARTSTQRSRARAVDSCGNRSSTRTRPSRPAIRRV